jgi:hypothetical protein
MRKDFDCGVALIKAPTLLAVAGRDAVAPEHIVNQARDESGASRARLAILGLTLYTILFSPALGPSGSVVPGRSDAQRWVRPVLDVAD